MKRSRLVAGGVLLAVAGLGAWGAFERYWYYLPGIVATITDPVGPSQAVAWRPGPASAEKLATSRPPNIVVILADDLGWNDLTFRGGGVAGGTVPTPRINSIGADGITFTQAYAGDATCAPSRAAIMTGRYATRFGFEFTPTAMQFSKLIARMSSDKRLPVLYFGEREKDYPPWEQQIVPTSEVMIGQVMKAQGYRTLMLGKWHLGGTRQTAPEARGFDEALAFYAGGSMYLPENDPNVVNSKQNFDPIDMFVWANLPFAVRYNGGKRFAPSAYMTDYLGEQAVAAIEANRHWPFFLYLAFNAPHTPLQALKSDYDALAGISDHRLRVYAAIIRALERNVGRVLDALKARGLEENTLVIFTSDNGGAHYIGLPDINKPFRGWKATFFEGGIHVPFLMKWPAKFGKGEVFEQPIGHVDIFATAIAAAGGSVPKDRTIDGVNLIEAVTGSSQSPAHRSLYWRDGDYKALLSGDFKLQVSARPSKVWLFNLRDDPTERKNLADVMPQRLKEMQQALAAVDAEQIKPHFPALVEAPVLIDKPLSFPYQPGDEYVYWAN